MTGATPAPAIVSLECGCFFQGRRFYVAPTCDLHEEDEEEDMNESLAWIHVVNEFEGDPEEQIADYTMTDWMRKHWPAELEF